MVISSLELPSLVIKLAKRLFSSRLSLHEPHVYVSDLFLSSLNSVLMTRLLPHHIRVNCLAPLVSLLFCLRKSQSAVLSRGSGLFPSEMTASPEDIEQKMGPLIKNTIPAGRVGQPHEIAGPVRKKYLKRA